MVFMTSQSKPPEPVGIKSLLELLNAAEGLASRDASLDDVQQPLRSAPLAVYPQVSPSAEARTSPPVERLADIADFQTSVQDPAVEAPIDETADVENRFAAHVVRGMSKSKLT
jgi:hypothetical protein